MRTFWNAGQNEIIRGLDILGIRQVDQSIEKNWVSNVTTISLRARYLSLLPWIIAEFFSNELSNDETGAVYDASAYARLAKILCRLEFVVAIATLRGNKWGEDGVNTGIRGSDFFSEKIAVFDQIGEVELPNEERSGIFGTYVNPCQGFGLVLMKDGIPKITPRGKILVDARKKRLGDSCQILELVINGGRLTAATLLQEGKHFSVNGLAESGKEQALLLEAFLKPYNDNPEVVNAYSKFTQTVSWAFRLSSDEPVTSIKLIHENYQAVVENKLAKRSDVEHGWAEYELRRRVHFSLELLLESFVGILRDFQSATLSQIMRSIADESELSTLVQQHLGVSKIDWQMTVSDWRSMLPTNSFLENGIHFMSLRNSITYPNKCVYALSLLMISLEQSRDLRESGAFLNRNSNLERVFEIIGAYENQSISELLLEIFRRVVLESHLSVSLRKMAEGQKCSLRVYPEGDSLRATNITVAAGHSGDRLGNVMGMLADLGVFQRTNTGFLANQSTRITLAAYGAF